MPSPPEFSAASRVLIGGISPFPHLEIDSPLCHARPTNDAHAAISAELGKVIGGTQPGSSTAEQITVYGGGGLAFQDVAAAWQMYRPARERGLGREIDFLAQAWRFAAVNPFSPATFTVYKRP